MLILSPSAAVTNHISLQAERVEKEPTVSQTMLWSVATAGAGRDTVENEGAETAC